MAGRKRKTKERLVYKAELIDRSGASYVTLLKDIDRGLLAPGRKIGGYTAWLESEVLAYFKALPKQKFIKEERRAIAERALAS